MRKIKTAYLAVIIALGAVALGGLLAAGAALTYYDLMMGAE